MFGGNRIYGDQVPDMMSGTESWDENSCRAARILRLIREQPVFAEPLAFSGLCVAPPFIKWPQTWSMRDSQVSKPVTMFVRFDMASALDAQPSSEKPEILL